MREVPNLVRALVPILPLQMEDLPVQEIVQKIKLVIQKVPPHDGYIPYLMHVWTIFDHQEGVIVYMCGAQIIFIDTVSRENHVLVLGIQQELLALEPMEIQRIQSVAFHEEKCIKVLPDITSIYFYEKTTLHYLLLDIRYFRNTYREFFYNFSKRRYNK